MPRRTAVPFAVMALAMSGLVTLAPSARAASGPATTVLTRQVFPGLDASKAIGAPPADGEVVVGIALAGRDDAGLARLVADQANPASPAYKQFLTPETFAARFGAAPGDAAAVSSWLRQGGLSISMTNAAGTWIEARGTAHQVEDRFVTHLATFGTPTGTFMANTVAPTVIAGHHIVNVGGLETLSTAHTHTLPADVPISASTSPSDLWHLYHQPDSNKGDSQQLTAFGWGSPDGVEADLRKFEAANNLPQVPFRVIQVGTPSTTVDANATTEWDLDTQASTGMAPKAAGMTFYFVNAGNAAMITTAVQAWADDTAGSLQASGSYGLCEALAAVPGIFLGHEHALMQASAEGRTFFASTGDNGSGCSYAVNTNGITIGPIPSQEYPASSAYAVAVGGTVIYTTGAGTAASPYERSKEIAWTHGGGGPAHFSPAPTWQTAAGVAPNDAICLGDHTNGILDAGNTIACRGLADVAAQGGDLLGGYKIVTGGTPTTVSGTSLSAPLWQGMWARINAAAPAVGGKYPGLGYANPLIYGIGSTPTKYAKDFFDVTLGANGLYAAGTGWDYPTGWGVPDVANLMVDLAGSTNPTRPVGGGGGGGGGGGFVPPADACAAGKVPVQDPAGDATQLAAADSGQPATNAPALDLRSADASVDPATGDLLLDISVTDLSQLPPQGGIGGYYRFGFSVGGTAYTAVASRRVLPTGTTDKFTLAASAVGSTSTAVTGSFGIVDANTMRIDVSPTVFKAVTGADLSGYVVLTSLSILGQRDDGQLTLTADSAVGTCSPVLFFPLVSTPTIPEAPLGVLLPVSTLLLLGGGFLVLRRRRIPVHTPKR